MILWNKPCARKYAVAQPAGPAGIIALAKITAAHRPAVAIAKAKATRLSETAAATAVQEAIENKTP
jgi:hypothetical protein